ncbi:MAG: hypothetical protein AB8B63_00120 [Granulosicoccus sp.]
MAHLPNNSGYTATTQSQCEFQLTAIETGLHKAITCIFYGEAANQAQFADCTAQSNISVTRGQSCVKLLVNSDASSTRFPSLQITPLFPGSYTQSEITVSGIQYDSAHQIDWAVLPPEFYFPRFKGDCGEDSLITDRNGINLVVMMLPGTDLASAENLGQRLRACPVLNRVTRVTLLCLSDNRKSCEHEQMRIASRIDHRAGLPANVKKQCKQLHIGDCHGIIHELAQHDIAFCPTLGLAIDAMNCGCACICPENTGTSLQTLIPAKTKNSSATYLRSALKTTACEQRELLVAVQQGLFAGHLITPWWHELAGVVQRFYLNNQPPAAAIACPDAPLVNERHERFRVISPPTAPSQTSASRLSNRSASTRRKLLKFSHSPQQFFNDSQRPELQVIARFLKGIDQ